MRTYSDLYGRPLNSHVLAFGFWLLTEYGAAVGRMRLCRCENVLGTEWKLGRKQQTAHVQMT